MSIRFIDRAVVASVLSGSYTPLDLREFVKYCHDLALPIIRKRIAIGKLNLGIMGLREADIVYDCIADLFQRNEQGMFPQIKTFLEECLGDVGKSEDENVVIALRRLVAGKVNNNIVRLYSESDPALGKILRNVKLAIERADFFKEVCRFNEIHLIPSHLDSMLHLPPFPDTLLKQEFSRVALIHDNVPQMLKKLHGVVAGQAEFQRAVRLTSVAILLKEVYTIAWKSDYNAELVEVDGSATFDIHRITNEVCAAVRSDAYATYVGKQKCTAIIFSHYMDVVRDALLAECGLDHVGDGSYYERLRERIPSLTKGAYMKRHRAIVEYLARTARNRLRHAYQKDNLRQA